MVATIIIGVVGMVFILTAFILDEFYLKKGANTKTYNLLNVLGSGLLIVYAYTLQGWPFLILNSVWCVVALIKLFGLLRQA